MRTSYRAAGSTGVPASASRLRVEQRNALVVRRLRLRLQISVDVGEILVRQDRLLIRRHAAGAEAHEGREGFGRYRIGPELRSGHRALPHEAVALPAAVLHVGGLAFLGGAGGQSGGGRERKRRGKRNSRPGSDPGGLPTVCWAARTAPPTLSAPRTGGPRRP